MLRSSAIEAARTAHPAIRTASTYGCARELAFWPIDRKCDARSAVSRNAPSTICDSSMISALFFISVPFQNLGVFRDAASREAPSREASA